MPSFFYLATCWALFRHILPVVLVKSSIVWDFISFLYFIIIFTAKYLLSIDEVVSNCRKKQSLASNFHKVLDLHWHCGFYRCQCRAHGRYHRGISHCNSGRPPTDPLAIWTQDDHLMIQRDQAYKLTNCH